MLTVVILVVAVIIAAILTATAIATDKRRLRRDELKSLTRLIEVNKKAAAESAERLEQLKRRAGRDFLDIERHLRDWRDRTDKTAAKLERARKDRRVWLDIRRSRTGIYGALMGCWSLVNNFLSTMERNLDSYPKDIAEAKRLCERLAEMQSPETPDVAQKIEAIKTLVTDAELLWAATMIPEAVIAADTAKSAARNALAHEQERADRISKGKDTSKLDILSAKVATATKQAEPILKGSPTLELRLQALRRLHELARAHSQSNDKRFAALILNECESQADNLLQLLAERAK